MKKPTTKRWPFQNQKYEWHKSTTYQYRNSNLILFAIWKLQHRQFNFCTIKKAQKHECKFLKAKKTAKLWVGFWGSSKNKNVGAFENQKIPEKFNVFKKQFFQYFNIMNSIFAISKIFKKLEFCFHKLTNVKRKKAKKTYLWAKKAQRWNFFFAI